VCTTCVEIIRGRITVKDALSAAASELAAMEKDPPDVEHLRDILEADAAGDVDKVKRLIDAGYRKERWL